MHSFVAVVVVRSSVRRVKPKCIRSFLFRYDRLLLIETFTQILLFQPSLHDLLIAAIQLSIYTC